MVEAALSRQLQKPADAIRAVWSELPGAPADVGQSVTLIGTRDVLVESSRGGFSLRYGPDAELRPDTPLPRFTAAVQHKDGTWHAVSVADPLIASWRLRMLAALLIGTGVLIIPIWMAARWLVSPIRKLEAAAVDATMLGPLPTFESAPKEIQAVAEAMKLMRCRLADEARSRAGMLAAVAHDLRTPLTAVRIRVEGIEEPERSLVIADLQRVSKMIDQALDYSRIGAPLSKVAVLEIRNVAADSIDRRAALGESVRLENGDGAKVLGDADLLLRALENLLDNAIRYGGCAVVTIRHTPGEVGIAVEDNGPGIPETELERIAEPFTRLDRSRSARGGGAGLGLAIVRDIAATHKGRLELKNTVSGFRATIWVPANEDIVTAR